MNRYFGLHTLEGEWHSLLPRYLLLSERVDGRRILDIGCGSGIGSSLLLELGAAKVDAIDHRPAVLELARMKHAKEGLDFHVMFWEELNFSDDTFDIVLCLDPSSPVTDPSLVAEVQRVLKPGGEYICAIERKQIEGLEVVLPRYGYADAAESIDVHPAGHRPPQVGELATAFDKIASVVQRPVLSFVFDVDRPRAEGQSTRKISDTGESGTWEQAQDGEGRWVPIDDTLQRRDADDAAVEVWFCGSDNSPPPPLREVRLPYFGLVERLHQVMNELQMRQVRGSHVEEPIFDEILDEGPEYERERHSTNEYRVVDWEDEPTGVRHRDDIKPPESATSDDASDAEPETADPTQQEAMADQRDRMESQLQELSALYQQVRHEFQTVVQEAQTALEERDRYIEHLVGKVQQWQTRFSGEDEEPPSESEAGSPTEGERDEQVAPIADASEAASPVDSDSAGADDADDAERDDGEEPAAADTDDADDGNDAESADPAADQPEADEEAAQEDASDSEDAEQDDSERSEEE
jgi:SAM-dependent methyltransferase